MENQDLLEPVVDEEAVTQLAGVSRWAKFLGVLVLGGTGLSILLVFFLWRTILGKLLVQDEVDERNMEILRIIFIFALLCVVAVVTVLMSFLIKGAVRLHQGLRDHDQQAFNSGLANLRNYFIMYGILAIIGLFFSLLGLLVII